MRRYWWLLVAPAVLAVLLLKIHAAAGQEAERFYDDAAIVSGGWAYGFRPLGTLTPQGQEITGYAFGPGRAEVACCGPAGGRWVLWKAALSAITEAKQQRQQRLEELFAELKRLGYRNAPEAVRDELHELASQSYDRSGAVPRPLWTAPEGVELRGPVWWAPDGTSILVRAVREGAADLVAVDDVTGEAVWLTRGKTVTAVAFPATSRRLAYVTEEHGARTVWERDFPAGEARALGTGGHHLVWSPDGSSLRWLAAGSGPEWAEMEWEAATGRVQQVGTKPARPEGTVWSPDGRWCAAVTEAGLALWPAASLRGEVASLPHVEPRRVVAWSPDSNLLLVSGKADALFLVMVAPPPSGAYVLDRSAGRNPPHLLGSPTVRAVRLGWFSLQPDVGDPSWSSDERSLAFAATAKAAPPEEASSTSLLPEGELFVFEFDRQYVEIAPGLTPEVERAVALYRMKNVALALNMYLTDYDRVPPVAERDRVVQILDEYVRNREVFMRPGKDELAVQWRFDPTKPLAQVEDPSTEVVAVMDYSPEFYVVAYMDGHVKLFEKQRE